jgi:hypothetical protein
MEIPQKTTINKESIQTPSGRRIQELELLPKGLSSLACCKFCGGSLDIVKETNIRGLSSSLVWKCNHCEKETSVPTSDFVSLPSVGKRAEVNLLAVGGIEMIGKGYSGLDTFLGQLGVPNMAKQTFANTTLVIGKVIEEVASESLDKA